MKVTACSPVCICGIKEAWSWGLHSCSSGCLKITCIGSYGVTVSCLPLCDTDTRKKTLFEIAWFYICTWHLCLCFSPYIQYIGLLYFCYWRTQLCSFVLNACLSDRVHPLISSVLGMHEYAWQPYLWVQSQMKTSLSAIELTFYDSSLNISNS